MKSNANANGITEHWSQLFLTEDTSGRHSSNTKTVQEDRRYMGTGGTEMCEGSSERGGGSSLHFLVLSLIFRESESPWYHLDCNL